MCREMSEAGLQEPQYYTNAFLLQTVVYNIRKEKATFSTKNPAIGIEKLAFHGEKLWK